MSKLLPITLTSLAFVLTVANVTQASSPLSLDGRGAGGEGSIPGSLGASLQSSTASDTIIAVGVDGLLPTAGQTAPSTGAAPGDAAAAFGYVAHDFGGATAVGPATLPAIQAQAPQAPMSDADLLTLFTASLDQGQWNAFRSDAGIGLGDLTSDDQVNLFRSFFLPGAMKAVYNFEPNEEVPVAEKLPGVPETIPNPIISPDDIPNIRLRLGLRPEIELPVNSQSEKSYIDCRVDDDTSIPATYVIAHSRAEAGPFFDSRPNAPSIDDLPADADWAKRPFALRAGETVADVLQTLRTAGAPEIYASPWYETLTLTVAGARTSTVSTADVLRSIAFAVGGAYRKVGDVYVLAPDSTGAGARWIALVDEVRQAKADRARQVDQAAADGTPRTLADLTSEWSRIGLTSDQLAALRDTGNGFPDTEDLPVGAMTPQQQDYVQRSEARLAGLLGPTAVDTTATPRIVLRPYLQALVPGIDAPAEFDTGAALAQIFPVTTPTAPAAGDAPPSIRSLILACRRRAAIVDIHAKGEVDDIVSAAAHAGMNEIWIKAEGDDAPAEFAEAVSAAQTNGIGKVFAYVDALDWSGSTAATAALKDLTANGQPWADAVAGRPGLDPASVYVSPFLADVKTAGLARVRAVAAFPGSAGLVLGSTVPPGYGESTSSSTTPKTLSLPVSGGVARNEPGWVSDSAQQYEVELGYTVTAREQFVRKTHADPIDVLPPLAEPFDRGLRYGRDRSLDDDLYAHWAKFRANAADALEKSLLDEAAKDAPAISCLVETPDGSFAPESTAPLSLEGRGGAGEGYIVDVPATALDTPSTMASLLTGHEQGDLAVDLRHSPTPADALAKLAEAP